MRGARPILVVLAAALAIAGCGSSSPSASPLGSALSYFPKNSVFVLSVVTDPNARAVKGGQAMLSRLPAANFGQAALTSRLQQVGINYDTDIRPLFGNPLVIGIATANVGGGAAPPVLAAWVTKDAGTLNSLIKKLRLSQSATHAGAAIYQVGDLTLAVDGATLVAGTAPASVNAALDRHAANGGMSTGDYDRDLGSLPKNALIEAVGNLTGVLSAPSAAKARSVPWVAALRGYGVAISASSHGLSFQYNLDTSGGGLTSSELPIAPGSSPPGLAGNLPIQLGLRQPAATLAFVLDTERRASPAHYAADQARMNAVRRETGVDFRRDVLGQIGNSAAIESSGHGFNLRVDVVNPAAAARTLRKLGTSALDVLGTHPTSRVSPGPDGFETIHRAHKPRMLFGLVGSEFVVGNGSPSQLRAFARAPAAAAPGAEGAVAFRVALPQLLTLALRHAPSKTVQQILSSLGDITGWLSSSSNALTGSATLALK
jgi:hypothetical protein